jgi:hypothetical protein
MFVKIFYHLSALCLNNEKRRYRPNPWLHMHINTFSIDATCKRFAEIYLSHPALLWCHIFPYFLDFLSIVHTHQRFRQVSNNVLFSLLIFFKHWPPNSYTSLCTCIPHVLLPNSPTLSLVESSLILLPLQNNKIWRSVHDTQTELHIYPHLFALMHLSYQPVTMSYLVPSCSAPWFLIGIGIGGVLKFWTIWFYFTIMML